MSSIKNQNFRTRYLITSEKRETAIGNRVVGSAFQTDGLDHMTVHLRILPGTTFFLAKNWSGFPEFILFSGRSKKDDGSFRFFHRVGTGYKASEETFIELTLPDLNQSYYLHLEPADFHYEESRPIELKNVS